MEKGEIARYEQFLRFPQCFQKACFPGASKGVIVRERVNRAIKNTILFPSILKGIHRAEAVQMSRYNSSSLTDIVHVCITSDQNTLGGMIALVNSIDQNSKSPVMYHLVVDAESVVHLK